MAPAGPLAVFPVELAQTEDGFGVIVGVAGFALMVTLAELVALHPEALVTVRPSVTLPEAPCT